MPLPEKFYDIDENEVSLDWLCTIAPAWAANRIRVLTKDSDRIDWLERAANQKGGILLHDGSETGRNGLGLRPGHLERTLRQAIDAAMVISSQHRNGPTQ